MGQYCNGPVPNVLTTVLAATVLGVISSSLGPEACLVVLVLVLISIGNGCLVCRAFGIAENPFLSLVIGFAVLSHALLAADLVVPGAHWEVVAALGLVSLAVWRGAWSRPSPCIVGLAFLVSGFAFVWNHDVASRFAHFQATGVFEFWVDGLVHPTTLAQFGSPAAIGRGNIFMADMPRALYHNASFMPAALITALLGMTPLEAATLVWLPLGMFIMACGVAALGLTLGGPALAALSIMGLAFVPAPEQLSLGNGFLSFAWLLEASPGTPYSIGIACAAMAALVHWMRREGQTRWAGLALALSLTAACFLTRFNTFVLLAPTIGLGVVIGWPGLQPRLQSVLVCAGILAFVVAMAALSWPTLQADPLQFLLGYLDTVHRYHQPKRLDGLQAAMVLQIGPVAAGLVDVPLTLLGMLGPWFPAFLLLGLFLRRYRATEDALPWLLLLVAVLEMFLAPMSPSGDITDFRHRAGPLVVSVIVIWSLHWTVLLARPWASRVPRRVCYFAWPTVALLSLAVLSALIGIAKRPAMGWTAELYNTRVAPGLMELAPAVVRRAAGRPVLAVANPPEDSPHIDDAVRLISLTGVPAYLSRASFFVSRGGAQGEEARRRLAIIDRLAATADLDALRALMRAEGITLYVTTSPTDLAFDPERRGAIARAGDYALYSAAPELADNR